MISKKAIKKELDNSIFVEDGMNKLGENYIYVTLGDKLKVYDTPVLDPKCDNPYKEITIPDEGLILEPNKLYLGRTNEYTRTNDFVPLLSGLTELATLGVEIHITAGFGDNGFEGTWTLEILCANPTILYKGMKIGKLYYSPLVGDGSIKYRGKYYKQIDATESRLVREYVK